MRVFLVICLFAVTLAGCGGGDEDASGPLTLSDRVLRPDEIRGFIVTKPAQVDAESAAFFDHFDYFPAPDEELAELKARIEDAGFVAGTVEKLGGVNKDDVGGGSIVVQVDSTTAAKALAERAYKASVAPCPNACNIDFSSFEVDDVPGAKGSGRLRAGDDASADSPAFEGYEVFFADGPFVYFLYTEGPPGEVDSDDIADAARNLYERVVGQPALTETSR